MIDRKETHIREFQKMKIVFLSNYSGLLDEGMANVSYIIFKNLQSKFDNLLLLNIKNMGLDFWRKVLSSKVDVVHYFPGPSLKGLLLVKLIQMLTNCKTVISATQPRLPEIKYFRMISMFLKPDIVLVQSKKSEIFFTRLNYKTKFIPNGVNLDKFVHLEQEEKKKIRKKYGFNENDFIILHVGPLKRGRNQYALMRIPDVKVLLVLSITNPSDDLDYKELKNENVIIWKRYIPNIQEVYGLADVYVWPSIEEFNGIEIPLSVLEAMACNLPVITTRYGALDRILQDGDGLFFIDKPEQINELILKIKNNNSGIATRKQIGSLSWENIAHEIANVYDDLCKPCEN